MKTRVDERLRREAKRFAFRFACDDCAHFDVAGSRCSFAYPASPRRDALDANGALDATDLHVELCKTFELG
jgi:hypothetical protein